MAHTVECVPHIKAKSLTQQSGFKFEPSPLLHVISSQLLLSNKAEMPQPLTNCCCWIFFLLPGSTVVGLAISWYGIAWPLSSTFGHLSKKNTASNNKMDQGFQGTFPLSYLKHYRVDFSFSAAMLSWEFGVRGWCSWEPVSHSIVSHSWPRARTLRYCMVTSPCSIHTELLGEKAYYSWLEQPEL